MIECRVWKGAVRATQPASIEIEVMLREEHEWARFDFYRDGVYVLALDAVAARELAHGILAVTPVDHPSVKKKRKRAP